LLGGAPGVSAGTVVILGGGVVGENAAVIATGMQAKVHIVDKSEARLKQLVEIFGDKIIPEQSDKIELNKLVAEADLLVGGVLIPGAEAPKLVTKDMLKSMKRGSVIVDVAIDQGGCVETSKPTTHGDPTYIVDNVVHYCVANMPGGVPRTSTFALNQATLPYLVKLANKGYQKALSEDKNFLAGLNVHKGHVTYKAVADVFGHEYVEPLSILWWKMKNIYHPDIYNFKKPVDSYWEETTKENFNLDKLTKDISSEVVVIGGGYTGLLCAINLIENYNLDVILLEAGKIGWGASSRNGGFCSFPPIKTSFKKLQKIYGKEETKKFFRNAVEGSNYTKDIISNYNIDCDVTGDCNFILAHHPNKFKQIQEQAKVYKSEFDIEAEIYSKEEFNKIGHGGTEQFGALSYKPGFAINPLKFVNGIARYAIAKKLRIFEHTLVKKIDKIDSSYILRTKEGSVKTKKIVVATNGFYQEGLVPQMNSRILPVISNIIVTRKLTKTEIDYHNFKTFSPIANTKNLLYYYRKLPDNRILFGTRGDFIGSDKSNLDRSKIMEKFLKNIFPEWSNISIDYNWRGLIAMSQKLTPSIGKIENEEIYYGFGYHGVGVSSAPWTGKQLSELVFSSNSKDLNISKIYKGLPKKFIFPKLRIFYFRLAVLFYNIKDKLNI